MVEYGLIGRGIGHSFSADFFNAKFARENIDALYSLFDLHDISLFPSLLKEHPALKGLNVTSPYKREVIPFLSSISEEAQKLQAVNVIRIDRASDGTVSMHGHNTDSRGFGMTLPKNLNGFKALVLGTGGAASAVCAALQEARVGYKVVSRTPSSHQIDYKEASSLIPRCRLIINASPVGMHPDVYSAPKIDYDKLTPEHFCYDLIYNPGETLFLKLAKAKGAHTQNGLEMLLNQAILAWEIWNER